MPGKVTFANADSLHEVLIFIITGITVFMVITGLLIFVLLFYQKRNLRHRQQLLDKEKEYADQLLQTQLEMQEQTFNTISREIHDNVGQILSLAKVQLNIMHRSEMLDMALLTDARDNLGKAMTDLRDIAKSLNSERIQMLSLPEITGHELQSINRAGIMQATLVTEGKETNMQEQKKLIVFRMIQESLHNIIKHSKARHIEVGFCYETGFVRIVIKDDGNGFDTKMISRKNGLGLTNMISRAALIGGSVTIQSKADEGTTITITSPTD